jgi:ABC-type transporter Mla MlaB component
MLAPPLAHLGHWYVSLPVFMGPVLLLVTALKIQTWREQHHGPDQSGKRSTVTTTHDCRGNRTITVTGPLDYPALLDIETELGKAATDTEILLDLRRITEADQEAAWSLCDAIGHARAGNRISALVRPEPAMNALRTICAEEGVELK